MTAEWIPEPHLGDFLAYDLDAIRADLEQELRVHPDAPGLTMLRVHLSARLPWDAAHGSPWRDPWLVRRWTWLRALVVDALAGDERPSVRAVLEVITDLVRQAEALEAPQDL